jgi:tetratricopeptide (TPR) repeat protein
VLEEREMALSVFRQAFAVCKDLLARETERERKKSLSREAIALSVQVSELSVKQGLDLSLLLSLYEERLQLQQQSLCAEEGEGERVCVGVHGLDTLITMATLAGLYQCQAEREKEREKEKAKEGEGEGERESWRESLDKAGELLEEAYRLAREYHGRFHAFTVMVASDLSLHLEKHVLLSTGDGDRETEKEREKAISLAEDCLTWNQEQFGERHPNTLKTLQTLARLCALHEHSLSRARALYEDCLTKNITAWGESHVETVRVREKLISVYLSLSLFAEALPLCESVYTHMQRVQGETARETVMALSQLAFVCCHCDGERDRQIEKAISLAVDCLKRCRAEGEIQREGETERDGEREGDPGREREHPMLSTVTIILARLNIALCRFTDAAALLEDSLSLYRSRSASEREKERDSNAIETMQCLAEAYRQIPEKRERAVSLLRDCLSLSLEVAGPSASITMSVTNDLARCLIEQGEFSDEAFSLFERCLSHTAERFGESHPQTLRATAKLGALYESHRQYPRAIELLESCLPRQVSVMGENHEDTLFAMHTLALAYGHLAGEREREMALMFAKTCLMKRMQTLGKTHSDTLASMSLLGSLLVYAGQYDAAVAVLEQFLGRAFSAEHGLVYDNLPDLLLAMHNVALAYASLGMQDQAIDWYRQHIKQGRAIVSLEDTVGYVRIWDSMQNLARLYIARGMLEDAILLLEDCLKGQRESLLGEEHEETLKTLFMLALTYARCPDKGELTLALYQDCLEKSRRVLGEEHPQTMELVTLVMRLMQSSSN